MNSPTCCHSVTRSKATSALLRRGWGLLQWLAPGTILVLMPKCPLCLAAYIALGTGIGLSLPVATYLRLGLLAACIASLTYLAVRSLRRFLSLRRDSQLPGTTVPT